MMMESAPMLRKPSRTVVAAISPASHVKGAEELVEVALAVLEAVVLVVVLVVVGDDEEVVVEIVEVVSEDVMLEVKDEVVDEAAVESVLVLEGAAEDGDELSVVEAADESVAEVEAAEENVAESLAVAVFALEVASRALAHAGILQTSNKHCSKIVDRMLLPLTRLYALGLSYRV